MLARQWQLGEFEGEDAGSPLYTKVTTKYGEISKILIDKESAIAYDGSIPLEVCIERMRPEIFIQRADSSTTTLELDLQTRVRLGLQFKIEMETTLKEFATLPNFNVKDLKSFLANQPELAFELDDRQIESDMNVTLDYLSAIRGRVIDIWKIFKIDGSMLRTKAEEYCSNAGITTSAEPIADALVRAFENLKGWWDGNNTSSDPSTREDPFFQKPSDNNNNNKNPAWNSRHLEYSFKVQIDGSTDVDNKNKLILDASEYKEDRLDWYSFTVDDLSPGFSFPSMDTRTLIPTHLKFRGMPEKRWWNFEDSYINFGALTPKTSNIATVLLTEFALIHSPDWYTIPYQLKEGMLSQVESLIVRDCFGDETQIEPAGLTPKERNIASNDPTWNSWSMFLLSRKYKETGQQLNTSYFFLPPVVDHIISSPPLEEVKFLRDEVANLVWAIERQYRTFYGEPVSGYDHYFEQRNKSEKASWKNIPGSDSSKLKDFLKHNYKVDWIESLEFMKNDDEKAINVSSIASTTPSHSLSVKLDDEPSKATKSTLTIDNDVEDEFNMVQENGEPKIILQRPQKSIKYTFMTGVPWNWIPFIPVHTTELLLSASSSSQSDSYAHIELQRAAMVKSITGKPVRPNSRLLNEVRPRYYIDESEVPRTGAVLSERYQRAVSSSGRVFLWIGRKKSIGAGEGSSGLKFDSIPIKEKNV
jgi:hypothetical protein